MRKTLDGQRRFVNGRRGSFQFLFAFVYLIIGAALLFTEVTPARQAALGWLGAAVPYVGYAWVLAAVLALTAMHRPRGHDSYGFAALTFTPLVFSGLFFVGIVFGAPLSGITSVVVYWLLGAAVMVVSGMQGDNDRCARKTNEP